MKTLGKHSENGRINTKDYFGDYDLETKIYENDNLTSELTYEDFKDLIDTCFIAMICLSSKGDYITVENTYRKLYCDVMKKKFDKVIEFNDDIVTDTTYKNNDAIIDAVNELVTEYYDTLQALFEKSCEFKNESDFYRCLDNHLFKDILIISESCDEYVENYCDSLSLILLLKENKCDNPNHFFACGCGKKLCDYCQEYDEDDDECEDENCLNYYKYRNDNCDCCDDDCPYCYYYSHH